jgi:hypothetical protein
MSTASRRAIRSRRRGQNQAGAPHLSQVLSSTPRSVTVLLGQDMYYLDDTDYTLAWRSSNTGEPRQTGTIRFCWNVQCLEDIGDVPLLKH